MINNKILGLLGISAKAGKIFFGADSVEAQIQKRKIKLIIIAEDSSDRTKKRFIEKAEKFEIPYLVTESIDTISKSIGKSNKAIVGITDINLAKQIQKIYYGGDVIG